MSRKNNRRATSALDQSGCGCVWDRTEHGDTIVLPCIKHAYSESRDGEAKRAADAAVARLLREGKVR